MGTRRSRANQFTPHQLNRDEVIAEFRRMAADAARKGCHSFETGWARAADRLEQGGSLEETLGHVEEPEQIDPNQMTFDFDLGGGL